MVTDHSEDLPRKGTEAMGSEEHWFAILFYATWVEHWINNILISLSRRSKVPEGVAVALVRSCGFNLKMKDVWTSLGATPIEKDVMRTMTDLMELRNGFVHYKWQARIISDQDQSSSTSPAASSAGAGSRRPTRDPYEPLSGVRISV